MNNCEIGDMAESFVDGKLEVIGTVIGTTVLTKNFYLISLLKPFDKFYTKSFILQARHFASWISWERYDDEYIDNIEDYYDKPAIWAYNSNGEFKTL